jgi:hypothetical protein
MVLRGMGLVFVTQDSLEPTAPSSATSALLTAGCAATAHAPRTALARAEPTLLLTPTKLAQCASPDSTGMPATLRALRVREEAAGATAPARARAATSERCATGSVQVALQLPAAFTARAILYQACAHAATSVPQVSTAATRAALANQATRVPHAT